MLHGMSGKIRGGQGVIQGAALKRVLVIKHGALGEMVLGLMPLPACAPACRMRILRL